MKKIFFSAAAVFALCFPLFGETADKFVSPSAGFSMAKPAEWSFFSAEEDVENIKQVTIKDEEFKEMMLKYATAPLVAVTKFKEPYDDINPSVKVNIKPLGSLKGSDMKDVLNMLSSQFEKIFDNYKVVNPPSDVEISKIKSANMRMNYTIGFGDKTFNVSSEIWIVPRGDYFFIIGAGLRQDEKNGSWKEIGDIIKTIKIDDEKNLRK